MPSQPCPCGSRKPYERCCGRFFTEPSAPTAEALMRSRYVAFYRGDIDYLIETHHPSTRPPNLRFSLGQSIRSTQWQALTILSTRQGKAGDRQGYVEFMAVYCQPQWGQLHERSRFLKEQGRWFYVDGESLPPIVPKRGQPCWCGSLKKYKHCHGANA